MNNIYNECESRMKDLTNLSGVVSLLSWDQETKMPEKGVKARSEQMSLLEGMIHEMHTDPKIGEMLHNLDANKDKLTDDQKVNVREWLHDYEKSVKVPVDLIKEIAKTTSLSHAEWSIARKESNFNKFAPWLTKLIDLRRKQAKAVGFKDCAYDALLDDYEKGATVKYLDPVINNLKKGLVPIIDKINNSGENIDSSFLIERRYPEDKQEELCKEIMNALGVTTKTSRLDRSAHPFCTTISPGDVRVTTRYNEKWMPQSLYGVIHESGHALYSLGFKEKYYGTPLGSSISVGIHESQSRFWENNIGRSRNFLEYLFPKLQEKFKDAMNGIDKNTYYRAVNRVSSSLIRVEADEVTYNMHIVVRYELEKMLLSGELNVADVPNAWNEKMEKYLGVKPKNDAEGCLQDVHWSGGWFGYFPTYLLGNLYSAQWANAITKDLPNAMREVEKGEFKNILGWLRTNIHEQGQRYSAAELVERVTGEKLNADYLLNYIKGKYGEIYNLSL